MIFSVEQLKTRLDKYLAEQLSSFSRSKIQRDIEAGVVEVNGVVHKESKFVVRKGDSIEYKVESIKLSAQGGSALGGKNKTRAPNVVIETLYDANGLLIIDKPAGLSVHPGAGVKGDSLSDLLLLQFPEIEGVGEAHRPGIVHRLDKDTSGVMLIAKSPEMYDYLKDAFAERKVKKEYIALVAGVPEKERALIDIPIGKSKSDFRKYATKNVIEPKSSLTEYKVLEVLLNEGSPRAKRGEPSEGVKIDKMALISVNLHTGRTHQIRVHMASIGHPLLGDSLYGPRKSTISGLHRQFLHARRIEVRLPDGTWIEAESELPNDLRDILVSLNSKQVSGL